MAEKKDEGRFTLQFSAADPAHRRVIALLNAQGRRSKAQYIVNAVLHYENRAPALDEHLVEAVVRRLLAEGADMVTVPAQSPPAPPESISYDDAAETLGGDGLNAIADALEAFRVHE
jgi:hypothetical protein